MNKNFLLVIIVGNLFTLTWFSEARGSPWFKYSPALFLGGGYDSNPGLLPTGLRKESPYYQVRPEIGLAIITTNGLLFNLNYNYLFNEEQRRIELLLPLRTETIASDYSSHHFSLGLNKDMSDRLTLRLSGEVESVRFPDVNLYNNWWYQISPGLQYTFPRQNTSVNLAYIVGQRHYPDRIFYQTSLSSAPEPTRPDIRDGMRPRQPPHRHHPMHPLPLQPPDQDEPETTFSLNRVGKQRDLEQGLFISLEQRFGWATTAEVTYYFHANSSNISIFDYYDHNILLNLSHEFDEDLAVDLSWQYQYRPYRGWEIEPSLVKRKDHLFKLSLEIKYQLTKGVELLAGYSYSKNNSRDHDQSYLAHFLFSGIRFYFDLWKI